MNPIHVIADKIPATVLRTNNLQSTYNLKCRHQSATSDVQAALSKKHRYVHVAPPPHTVHNVPQALPSVA